ncbi:hypothetical protein A5906_25825 [Bradyrhizobium sacchari]|uniref:Uncharacterized protein n=1 Tax=Bradyrhizobium sacchari TaxID=1399419 RepID=A0A560JY74_9BRAD|nr:hypothetical protein [Bradyrhizobium sacchari]OPY99160.1 hypothetical protein A5906_25825 [Bradyrhizobium sacchari]TWB63042.1 hypothetical protein FBZ94_103742 [Bradyrhizobium sacchari]TWB76028.1 hypothetical protein FBZ95_104208 [Bradyrhizobium sacchari]
MAARAKKQPIVRKRATLALGDPRWVLLRKGHDTISKHISGAQLSPLASADVIEALKEADKKKNLRSMRRSLIDPSVREPLDASFWADLRIDVDLEKNALRILPTVPIRRFRDFRNINAWHYYVWEPDIDRMLGKPSLKRKSPRKRRDRRFDAENLGSPASQSSATAEAQANVAARSEQSTPLQMVEKRKRGSRPPLLSLEEIAESKEYAHRQLDADPAWLVAIGGKQNACVDIIANKIPRLGSRAEKCWRTISRRILEPVLAERKTIG